ncbi:helix-turn-helix transcriptional regulator [Paenibacillus methanolicus]|uniref:Putative DNA-binding transcriptional regulator YafY n=1 Tax=Paenibacillus methanolicus TaxID=582686 RepID=A0A5S5CHS8_9BACL|nr:YafY family protein [Paenibacillus methanolicus]TYP79346.1 putative DNA-binding transcriptional regulator YafY [Paenibacillus methanolicus]
MKIDRLLGIVIYLLSRKTASARALAEKFEVSARTIQRDMETLSLAGIPVGSSQGVNGGYYIMDRFEMNSQVFRPEDYNFILTALKGLRSGYDSRQAEATLEKMVALLPVNQSLQQHLHLDFGVLREVSRIRSDITALETAISKECAIGFEYTNAANQTSQRLVDPLIITYKWYAWYLYGFCREKRDYRLFRVSRMRHVASTTLPFIQPHENGESLLAKHQDQRPHIQVKLLCPADLRISIEEAFPNALRSELERDPDHFTIEFSAPEWGRGWFGTLLAYGNRVTVLEPEPLKQRIRAHVQSMLELYP